MHRYSRWLPIALLVAATVVGCGDSSADSAVRPASSLKLLNVSYDPTREFYAEFNPEFRSTGGRLTTRTSKSRSLTAGRPSRPER